MSRLKQLSKLLPTPLRAAVRDLWRTVKGNPEFHVLRLLADPDKLAVDVGANHGAYSFYMARLSKGCVAFEPNPKLAASLEKKSKVEGLGVRVNACALSDKIGEVVFSIPVIDGKELDALATIEADNRLGGAEVTCYTVPCRRLDDFELDRVGMIKVDAEGHEGAVLEGARSLIGRDRPALMVEVEDRHKKGSVDQVRRFFSDLGFEGFFLLGRRLMPIQEFDPVAHQDPANIVLGEVAFDGVYVNNFIFAADSERVDRLRHVARSGKSL
jgi:FkbM family methyltransferase